MRLPKIIFVLVVAGSLALNGYLGWHAFWRAPQIVPATTAVGEPIVIYTKGGLLEVSKVTVTEQFQASKDHTIFGVPVGNTVSWISVPAVYRYHIPLAPEWKVRLIEKSFVVIAPAVAPSLPVAIQTAQLQKQSAGVWSAWTGTDLLNELERTISAELGKKAVSPSMVLLQRDVARNTVKDFVQKWLISQEKWKEAAGFPVLVYFEDEPIQELRKSSLFSLLQ